STRGRVSTASTKRSGGAFYGTSWGRARPAPASGAGRSPRRGRWKRCARSAARWRDSWSRRRRSRRMRGTSPRERARRSGAKSAHDLIVRLGRVREEPITALAEAALPFAARCRERLLEAGLVPFDGLLRLTRDLLARHVPVRRALAARYRTMLVDEFQDTDP